MENEELKDKLKLALTSKGIDMPSEEMLDMEIEDAKLAINNRRGVEGDSEILPGHIGILIELCVESISKYGAEGEMSHGENGISRVYDNASRYSNATLYKIIPRMGAF